jgi:hypothetical protein
METPEQVYMAIRRAYWYGFFSYMGFNMLIQDWMGLEGYIAFVRENWMDLHWVVGLGIAATGMALRVAMLDRFKWLANARWNVSKCD